MVVCSAFSVLTDRNEVIHTYVSRCLSSDLGDLEFNCSGSLIYYYVSPKKRKRHTYRQLSGLRGYIGEEGLQEVPWIFQDE